MAINGVIARVLISSPIHAKIQWSLEIVSSGPMIRLVVMIVLACGFISTGRILTNIFGVWAQELN